MVPQRRPPRARTALRELVRHGFLTPPTDTDERWRPSHMLAWRYAGERARVLDCGSPLPLSDAPGGGKAPEHWRTPRPGGVNPVPGETPLLLSVLADWVVAAFAAAVKGFQDPRAPAFQRLPEAFGTLMSSLVAEYLRVLTGLGREPDFAGPEAFLVPVLERLTCLGGSGGEPPA